jgi:hypothetical protein
MRAENRNFRFHPCCRSDPGAILCEKKSRDKRYYGVGVFPKFQMLSIVDPA